MKKTVHKALSMALTVAIVFNMGLGTVFAEDIPIGACHTEHDEYCGYSENATPCTHTCEVCKVADSDKASTQSETVNDLIAMVEALPNAADITEENLEPATQDFEMAAEVYEALPAEDKEMFDTTEQHQKLVELLGTLYNGNLINWDANQFAPTDVPFTGELPSKDEVSALVEQMYRRDNIRLRADEEPLKTIEIDRSRIIHRPVDYMPIPTFEQREAPSIFGLIDSNQSGPFDESDERYFRISISNKDEGGYDNYRAVKGKLVAKGNNTNVWVVDDADFHGKVGNQHDSATCNLNNVTYAMAKDLAIGFDGIYDRMTKDFGSLELYEAPFKTLTKFGDLGNDGYVNILLYDIDILDGDDSGFVAGYFINGDMFDANRMYDDSETIHPIDMLHVDIGMNQGWDTINGDEKNKLLMYSILAHEFQHMLFYTHFSVYLTSDDFPPHYYDWFNESLSGLAQAYYVQPGVEIITLGDTAYAASNPYDGSGYGDLFVFNGSYKNYSMGLLFSSLFHHSTKGAYAKGVYDFFDTLGTDRTKEGFVDKYNEIHDNPNFTSSFDHVGAMLKSGLHLEVADDEPLVALLAAYQYFMENFAADGGLQMQTGMPTQKMIRSTEIAQNLWALRPLLGQYALPTLPPIPTIQSGGQIIIDSGDSEYLTVTRDMMYKLEGGGKVINITVDALPKEKVAFFYLALKNEYSATGADIFPLEPGVTSRIVTNGRDAFFFTGTFMSAISESDEITVNYTWEDIGEGELDGTASIDNTVPRIGDTLTGNYTLPDSYTGTAIAEENIGYEWFVGSSADVAGDEKTYTVQADDLGMPIRLFIYDKKVQPRSSVQAVTAAVKKSVYTGSVADTPTVAESTHNSITLHKVENCEYSNGGEIWQDSPIFKGLSPDVAYRFYSRVKETTDTEASEKSAAVQVTTISLTVLAPSIMTQPVGANYNYGDVMQPLTITADGNGGKLTYHWYMNTTDSTTGGTLVANTTAASYTPTEKDARTLYYYCVVSKTEEGETATITSDTAAIKIDPRPILGTVSVMGVSKPYDGNTSIVGTPPTITFADAISGETPTATATFAYDTATVGMDKTVTATNMTLIDKNNINANYTLSATTARGTGAEIIAISPTYDVADQKIAIGKTLSNIQATSSATGVNGEPVSGTLKWSEMQDGNTLDSYTFTGATDSTKTLYWTFMPTSSNYTVLSGSTTFTLTEKKVPTLTVSNITKTYDGLEVTTVTGTAQADDTSVAGTFAFDAAPTMKAAGTYNARVKFMPSNLADYEIATTSITITIKKAAIKADVVLSKSAIATNDALPTPSITYTGVVSGESLTPTTTATFTGMPVNSNTVGTYTITWRNRGVLQGEIEALSAYANYTADYTDTAILTINRKSTGGGGGGSVNTPTPTPNPENGNVNLKPSVDKDGNATITISDKNIEDTIQKAQEEAEKNGTTQNGIAVTITLDTDKTLNSFTATLPKAAQERLIATGVTTLAIDGDTTIAFDLEAIKQIHAIANADVIVTASKTATNTLSAEAQGATGGRPVYDFKVTGGGKNITTFGNGKLSLSIPYALQRVDATGKPSKTGSFENPDNLVGVYIDANGKPNYLADSGYHATSGIMRINTDHLSVYGVAYKASTSTFTDIANHWAKDDISFVATKGLLTGTGNNQFRPDDAMTRGMFVTAIGRLAGVDTKAYSRTTFTDVKADAYYAPYVAWAKANSIVHGTTTTTFSPDKAISRQEMAVMLLNYTKAIGYKLPSVHAEIAFTDKANIDTWAQSAVKEMQMAGILMGKDGGKFDPIGTATRAEASAMLHRFVALMANRETIDGR